MTRSCGAKDGDSPVHLEAARQLARSFHEHGISLVYGGGTSGIMGELAKTLVSLSGPKSVHGIIPAALMKYEQGWDPSDPSSAGKAVDEAVFGKTTVVQDMHTRKRLMAQEVTTGGEGGGFVALTGGYGTLEELMEVTTWNQLGIHDKGVVVYNVDGYWDGLIHWVKTAVKHGFIADSNAGILVEAKEAEEVVSSLKDYKNAPGRFNLDWKKEG